MYRCVPILLYLQNQAPLIYTMSIILGLLQLNLSSNTDTRQWLWSSFVIGVCFCLCNPATSKPFYFVLKSILYSDPWYLGIFFYWSIVALQCCIVSAAAAKSFQLCPTLCDPRDDSPPVFPAPGILQARALEWVAISFSIVSTIQQNLTHSYSLH